MQRYPQKQQKHKQNNLGKVRSIFCFRKTYRINQMDRIRHSRVHKFNSASPRPHKLRYIVYMTFMLIGLFVVGVQNSSVTFAMKIPSDAKGKNVVKPEKVCPKGKYLNPETNRCKKFEEQKVKTCPNGYQLNVKTNRCNKIPKEQGKKPHGSKKPKSPSGQNKPRTPSSSHSPKICPAGSVLNLTTKRCNKVKTPVQKSKTCRAGYFFNQVTHRCNKESSIKTPKVCPAGFTLNPITHRCKKNLIEPEKKPCKPGQARNPRTGRCHKLASTTIPKTCPAGKVLNPATNRCKKSDTKDQEPKPCKEGYERNVETNRCRKIHQNTGTDHPLDVPKLGDSKKTEGKKDFTGTTAIAGSAAVGIGIAIFQFKDEILVIIRKLFLHK